MVLQKSSDYGVDGVPHVPRAARSVRRRSLLKNRGDDQEMRAFDLLATVAGDLLSDRKSSSPSVVEDCSSKEDNFEDKPLENLGNRDIQERNFLCTELVSGAPDSNIFRKELPFAQNDAISRPTSLGFAEQLVDDCKLRLGICTPRVNVELSGFRPSVNCSLKDSGKQIKADNENSKNLSNSTMADISSSGHAESSDNKLSTLVSSVDSVKLPFCKDHSPCGSFPVNRDNVKLVNRDDDENFCMYTESSTRNETFSPPDNFGDGRIRKLPKVSQKRIDDECFDGDTKRCNYLNRKNSLKWQRSLRDYPLKKRKLYDCAFASNSGERIKCDKICSAPGGSTNGGPPSSSLALQGGKCSSQISLSDTHMRTNLAKDAIIPTPASAANENATFSSNHQVKLKIKSFRVPEMFLEFPESTTVGSLKKTVMEAVNAVFGGGLRVEVILQGKKIRDDNRTLLQSEISRDNKMDTLGFTLEPSSIKTPIKFRREDRPGQHPHDGQPPPTRGVIDIIGILKEACDIRSYLMGVSEPGNLDSTPPEPRGSNSNNCIGNVCDSTPFPPEMSSKKTISESKALVSVPSMVPDALAVVPFQKSKRSESSQRRIRRPFSVSEVEALVRAVEKLGTGRWRDVKLRAFDNAKRRTYVDLKDKWKTLVHTARISSQQRRGEPVPQELLDRVLAAHAYWSHHQARHQLKSQPETCLLL